MATAPGKWAALARRAWNRRGVGGHMLWMLLLPWSAVFRIGVAVRNALYRTGRMSARRLPLPVVSVGNLTVGGTGKTPASLWLARGLQRRGLEAAILSRGYGGGGRSAGRAGIIDPTTAGSGFGRSADELLEHGDEPVMLSALYGLKVGVGADRYNAGLELSRRDQGIHLFLLDDGFQHRRLARDLDLVLLGADCGGSLLPAGPFREPVGAVRRADILVVTGSHDRWREVLRGRFDESRIYFASFEPRSLVGRTDEGLKEFPLGELTGSRVLAVSAVAGPEPFYDMIRQCEASIAETVEFPDHHVYSERDWREISRNRLRVDRIVTTEKDYVKLARFPFSTGKLLALRIELTVDRPEALLDHIAAAVRSAGRRDATG